MILDSNMKIHRLVESQQVLQSEEGNSFNKQAIYKVGNTVDLERKLGKDSLKKFDFSKIFNQKYPTFNIT